MSNVSVCQAQAARTITSRKRHGPQHRVRLGNEEEVNILKERVNLIVIARADCMKEQKGGPIGVTVNPSDRIFLTIVTRNRLMLLTCNDAEIYILFVLK